MKTFHLTFFLKSFGENWVNGKTIGLRLAYPHQLPSTLLHIYPSPPFPPPPPPPPHTHTQQHDCYPSPPHPNIQFQSIFALFLNKKVGGAQSYQHTPSFNSSPSIPVHPRPSPLTLSFTNQPTFNFLAASKVSERASNAPGVSPARRPNVTSYWPLLLQDPRRWISDINCGG